eukprot:scaffold5974_cov158-Ochromonas_danica.AAC.7
MSDPIFQRTLQDLVKGIRSHKKDTSSFISQAIVDIKNELKSTDPFIKAEAMNGFNMSWASFHIIEVMSQNRFGHKRIGYLAANQIFDESTDVILLTTNLFKKEFSNMNCGFYEIGLAINCLANIVTKELARDCIADVVTLMNHQQPYVRKKAILAMYKLYMKYPQGLRLTFDKLKERLDDSEMPVVSTAVNVICELANKNPRNYLPMAPKLFRLLTTSSNNWMLIKVVKLMTSLVSEEPRLARKLLDPLSAIIQNTTAKSLQYECIYALTEALPHSRKEDGSEVKNIASVIKLCSDSLKQFVADPDQNLKYLGLVGLCNLMRSSPRSILEHRDSILHCLDDEDTTIRTKALELLSGVVSKRSLIDLVNHLREHARRSEGTYRDEVISTILIMSCRDKYSLVTDFAWYICVLADLAVMPGSNHGEEVANQLIDIALRVEDVRPFAVDTCLSMLFNDQNTLGSARDVMGEVLRAAAFIIGEYAYILSSIAKDTSDELDDEEEEEGDGIFWIEGVNGDAVRSLWRGQKLHCLAMKALLHPRVTILSSSVQIVFIQAATKCFFRASTDCTFEEISEIVGILRGGLPLFIQSQDLEVQERASVLRLLLSELGILSTQWEQSLIGDPKMGSDEGKGTLIDQIIPQYSPISLKEIDDAGARQVQLKQHILQAMIGEAFYAVHSKAQKKVPVPEDLNLDEKLNSSALDKLLETALPQDSHINKVHLLSDNGGYRSSAFEVEPRAKPYGSNEVDAQSQAAYSDRKSVSDHTTVATDRSQKPWNDENSVFILGNKHVPDIAPLSRILGEGADDIPLHQDITKSNHTSTHKKHKHVHRHRVAVDRTDVLPAGGQAVDDSDSDNGKRSKVRSKPKVKSGKKVSKDGNDLGDVDITTPLRADEVLYVPTHRTQYNNIDGSHPSSRIEEERIIPHESSEKRKSKDKEKVRKKKHISEERGNERKTKKEKLKGISEPDHEKKGQQTDLLALDWHSSPLNVKGERDEVVCSSMQNSNGINMQELLPPVNEVHKKLNKEGRLLMEEKGCCSVYYDVTCNNSSGQEMTIRWYIRNDSQVPTDVHITIPASSVLARPIQVPVSSSELTPGKSVKVVTVLNLASKLMDLVQLPCSVRLASKSVPVNCFLLIDICGVLKPLKLSEDAFFSIFQGASASVEWMTTSLKIEARSKPKKAWKMVAQKLHAHVVESESSSVASLAAQCIYGQKIFCLVKASKKEVTVDIKMMLSNIQQQMESQRLLNALKTALEELEF